MATELGVAYLSLAASTDGFAKDVKKAMGDAEGVAGDTGKRAGSRLGSGIKTGMKVAGGAILGVTGLVAGLALKGGISRALAIEDAQAKLEGLGHSTESIQTIMDSALDSVRGTAFGLGDAASVAATVVAAGVAPGEDLTRTLKLVADASTIAGTSMGDMGSIFNKVAGTGKIQGEVIAQLGERGIPILALLADKLGVTAGEVSKMASEGKIDFATFQDAMEAGMGGAALASGDTFRGAMANAGAALGRLGEKVVGGILPQIKDGFGGAIEVLDTWAPHAEAAGEAIGRGLSAAVEFIKREVLPRLREFGAWFAAEGLPRIQAFAGWITGTLVPGLQAFGGWIVRNQDWLKALAVVVGTIVLGIQAYVKVMAIWRAATAAAAAVQAAFNLVLAANPIGIIILAIAALVAGLIYFFTQTETGKAIVDKAMKGISAAIKAVTDWWTKTALPALKSGWEKIQGFFTGGRDAVKRAMDNVLNVIKTVWKYSPIGLITGNWDKIMGFIRGIPGKVKAQFDRAVAFIKLAWQFSPIGMIQKNWDKIVGFFRDIPGRIKRAFGNAANMLKDIGRKIIQGLIDGIKGAFTKVKDTLGSLTASLPDWKGPARVDRKLLAGPADDIMGGFVNRLEHNYGDVRRSLMGLTADLPTSVNVNANPVRSDAFGNGGPTIQQTNNITNPDPGAVLGVVSARLSTAMAGAR